MPERDLTLAERVECLRAVEGVYWRHRSWPAQNPKPKPDLAHVLTDEDLARRAEDSLRMTLALRDRYHREITAAELQAEMDRMVRSTRRPEILAEIFASLHSDPFLVAECLARPALVERRLRTAFSFDERIQSARRAIALSEYREARRTNDVPKGTGEIRNYVLTHAPAGTEAPASTGDPALDLSAGEWQLALDRLARELAVAPSQVGEHVLPSEIPLGRFGALREEESYWTARMVLEATDGEIRIASVVWRKEAFKDWWRLNRTHYAISGEELSPSPLYVLPGISQQAVACTDDTWTGMSGAELPLPRSGHSAVWTGAELIVWGGFGPGIHGILNTGGRYDPATDTWTQTSTNSAPSARAQHTAIWSGTEMIVWGGTNGTGNMTTSNTLSSGGRYNPVTDTWRPTSLEAVPARRYQHTAIWTGAEMIVWGGRNAQGNLDTGGSYDPLVDQWTETSSVMAPSPRHEHTAVWTGTEMIVWGGRTSQGANLNTGGLYDPSTSSWRPTSVASAPVPRVLHSAVWSGNKMIVWGGADSSGTPLASGGLYDPSADAWSNMSATSAPTRRYQHSAVWTGTSMIVWGGWGLDGTTSTFLRTGGRYSPSSNSWTPTSLATAPSARTEAAAVWTGTEMIVWGGRSGWGFFDWLDTGGRYDPLADSWVGTSTSSAPLMRNGHTAVWTGSEMLIWGGLCERGVSSCDNGGRYDPATDAWTPISTVAAPAGHVAHSAVWTGTEMIVWGGNDAASLSVNSGGRYNPSTNQWTSTSTASAPAARSGPTAVWTGSEMIVWGGYDGNSRFGTGGRYSPSADVWTPTSMVLAPSPRAGHIAVWTGAEMVIWGGADGGTNNFDTGGRYTPSSDQWSATSTLSAPSGRRSHTAVWSGDEVIIWGGRDFGGYLSAGGRYRPATDTWTSMSTNSAPAPRVGHSAVWTGSEMLVWGGIDANQYFGDGGRYSPLVDRWAPIASHGAPSARVSHGAVWTGSEMLVWGGSYGQEKLRTGARYCAAMISAEPQPARFEIQPDPVPDQQVAVPFLITVRALDSSGQQVRVDAKVSLRTLVPGISASPSEISLQGGRGSANVSIDRAAEDVRLQVTGRGALGTSSPFKVGTAGSCRFRGSVWTSDFPRALIPGAVLRLVPVISGEPLEIVATDGTFDTDVPCKPYSVVVSFGTDYSGVMTIFPLGFSVFNFTLSVGCDPTAVNPVLLVPGYIGSTTGNSWSTIPMLGGSGSPATYNDSTWPDWNPSFSFGGLHQYSFAALGIVDVPDWEALAATLRRISPHYRVGCAIIPVPWDWRREIGEAARIFLTPAIEDAVARSGGRRTWIVTHSTGALLARSYLRQQGDSSTGSASRIEKLVMIAPANQGSAKAYYGAQGGMPEAIDDVGDLLGKTVKIYRRSAEKLLEAEGDDRGNRICYPHIEVKFKVPYLVRNDCQADGGSLTGEDLESERAIYHERLFKFFEDRVKSAAELVPSAPFLLDSASDPPRAPDCPGNAFLADLNDFDASVNRSWLISGDQAGSTPKVKTRLFAGCGEETVSMIRVAGRASGCRSGLFADGEPLVRPTFSCPSGLQGDGAAHGECKTAGGCESDDKSLTGDGTLVLSSTAIPGRGDLAPLVKPASHTATVAEFAEDVARFLCDGCTLAESVARKSSSALASTTSVLAVALIGRAQPYLNDPLGRASGVNPTTSDLEEEIPGATMKLAESASILGIVNPAEGSYTMTLSGQFSEEIQLRFTAITPSGETAELTGFVFKGAGPRTIEFASSAGPPILSSPNWTAVPVSVIANTVGSSPAMTRLEWSPPAGTAVTSYRVYSRRIDEPHFSLAFTTSGTAAEPGDPWAGEAGEEPRIYAVASVDTLGRESFMAGFVTNDDRDHDGLSDVEETAYGTSLLNADTDGDGLRDLEEKQAGTNPLEIDTDGDAFSDLTERRIGSDPLDGSSIPAASIFSDGFETGTTSTWSGTQP